MRLNRLVWSAVALPILVCLAGAGAACAATAATYAASSKTGDSAVVVRQGAISVSLADVDALAAELPQDKRGAVFNSPQRIDTMLRSLLMTKQLAAEARTLNLQQDPVTAAAMQRAADQVLANARLEVLRKAIQASIPDLEELAHERYDANLQSYMVPAQIDVKHILINTKQRSDAEAKALAEKIYADLREHPDQFASDVETYSDDSSKKDNHGMIANATSESYVPAFRNAAEKLTEVGQISEPIKSKFGYHILKAVKIVPAHQKAFGEVHDAILATLRKDYVDNKLQRHLDELRSRRLDPDSALIASLRTRYDTTPAKATSVVAP